MKHTLIELKILIVVKPDLSNLSVTEKIKLLFKDKPAPRNKILHGAKFQSLKPNAGEPKNTCTLGNKEAKVYKGAALLRGHAPLVINLV